MTNPTHFAFPIPDGKGDVTGIDATGLTKREYFAAMAMQGLLASWGSHDVTDLEEIACDAAKAADHLINALNQQG